MLLQEHADDLNPATLESCLDVLDRELMDLQGDGSVDRQSTTEVAERERRILRAHRGGLRTSA
jgi:hypothetical protein